MTCKRSWSRFKLTSRQLEPSLSWRHVPTFDRFPRQSSPILALPSTFRHDIHELLRPSNVLTDSICKSSALQHGIEADLLPSCSLAQEILHSRSRRGSSKHRLRTLDLAHYGLGSILLLLSLLQGAVYIIISIIILILTVQNWALLWCQWDPTSRTS